jgi:hypothetical protein
MLFVFSVDWDGSQREILIAHREYAGSDPPIKASKQINRKPEPLRQSVANAFNSVFFGRTGVPADSLRVPVPRDFRRIGQLEQGPFERRLAFVLFLMIFYCYFSFAFEIWL